ncbi:ABC transporter substrate-binding protein [Sediminispirochaeta bajacaliforniensis]|uniref:ABC transporter substrate-binding protein n=1 Tax=Sediminispirochaeta bajacaliforniensis TaxID=148 RepID=UPI00036EA650|nr:extracellular solute-binding protein [Sediminispirochaeta bajacaliforniensis]
MKRFIATSLALVVTLTGAWANGQQEKGSSRSDEIVLYVFDAHAYGLEQYAEMVDKFEAEHPGVKIEVQHAANDSQSLLRSRINSNDIPDVFDVESGTLALSYYEYAYNWSDDASVLAKFKQSAIDTGKDSDGNVMSLPWTYENMGLIYNKDLFARAGITKLPSTMDELEAACKKLDAKGIPAFALAGKETWVLAQTATHFMMDKGLDAEGVTEQLNNGQLKFKEMKNFRNLFRFLDLVMKYGVKKPLEVDWETSENKIANNQAAIIHMGDWCQSTLDSFNPDAHLAFLPFPVGNDPKETTLLSSCNWTYIVNKDSDHLELAKEYAEYILSSDMGQYWMCEGVGAVPGCKTQKNIRGYLANDAKTYIAEAKTNGWIHTRAPLGFNNALGGYLQAYMIGQMSAEQVIAAAQDFWDKAKN